MLELQVQRSLLEKVIESIKDSALVVSFKCSASGISLQVLDSRHVAFVALLLHAEGFEHYRCDTNFSIMGINIDNMEKIIKCAGNDDIVTLKAASGSDTITFTFKNPNQGKIADFEMKLMDDGSEHYDIPEPESEYSAIVRMPSAMFAKICRDFSAFGDTVVISVSKEGVKFTTSGATGVGNIVLTENTVVDKPEDDTIIEMKEPVSSTIELSYLNSFTKATPLSKIVTISLSSSKLPGHPALIEYKIAEISYIKFYVAPKMKEDD